MIFEIICGQFTFKINYLPPSRSLSDGWGMLWRAGHIPRLKKVPWTLLHRSIELRRAAGLVPVVVVVGEEAAEAVAPFSLYVLFAEIF